MTDAALRPSPLADCHREAGARMVPFAGWEMPVQYRGVLEEHRAVRERAGLFDVSHMGELVVRGGAALAFLQRLTPNDVGALAAGRIQYSGLLNESGGYVDDILVYCRAADEYLLVVNAANAEGDFAWLREHLEPGEDVELDDVSADTALLALQGPAAAEILGELSAATLAGLRYYRFLDGEVAGMPVMISRTGYTGEDGFELYLSPDDAPALWRALLATGAGRGLLPAGLGARDTLRLEAAMALYGHEIDAATTPWEAGLDWVVKLESGDFLGRAALVEQRERGVPRALVGFHVEDRGIAREGAVVLAGDRQVGVVTSGTYSPTFERALGLASIKREAARIGAAVDIEVRGRRLAARQVAIPFYRRPR